MFEYEKYVYAVYAEKSFTKAAAKLFVSQPALSATIKKQEAILGFKIFIRSSPQITLTQEGEAYIEAIEKLYSVQNELKNKISDISALKAGSITLAGSNFVSSFILSKIIERFSSKFPNIQIKLIESNSLELEEIIIEEKADILLDYGSSNKNIKSDFLLRESILLAVPASFPINEKLKDCALTHDEIKKGRHLGADVKGVSLDAFDGQSFILLKEGNSMNKIASNLFEEFNINISPAIELDQLMTSYNMCNLGMGIAFLSDTLIKSVEEKSYVKFYKINSHATTRSLFMEYKHTKYLNSVMRQFMNTAREVFSQ